MNTQSNTRPPGPFPIQAGADLREKEAHVCSIGNSTGTAVATIPAATATPVDHLILEGSNNGETSSIIPLEPSRNFRARIAGTANPGEELCHDGAGKVQKVPVAAGTYYVFAKCEEAAVDGQLALIRPILNARPVVVGG